MDKQKQIEEMAREIAKRDCHLYEKCPKKHRHSCLSQEPEIMGESSKNYITIATWLVNVGYRKIPENAVVLTEEELFARDEKIHKADREYIKVLEECINNRNAKARKETAEKFSKMLKENYPLKEEFSHLHFVIDEICKEISEGK